MDPVTHALVGSATARLAFARPLGRAAWLPGAVGALLPDADAMIRSSADPLLYAEFHRHFTHALAFIPAGGLVASLPWLAARSTRPAWRWYAGAATAGYATHGLLDAATTYGTRLLWPFSDTRVGWDWMPIVDPLFTLVLIVGVAATVRLRSLRPLAVALALCLAYVALGAAQRTRALEAQARIAGSRGHEIRRGEVFPGIGSTVLWRSLYETDGRLHMDRVRVPWLGLPTWREGPVVVALTQDPDPPEVTDPARRRDLDRFLHFTNGWAARVPSEPAVIGDARYSMSVDEYSPVWGIRFESAPGRPRVAWVDRSAARRIDVVELWNELRGADRRYASLP